MIAFPERLRGLRRSRNIMAKTVADKLGISYRNYQRYERGEMDTPSSKLIALADYFGVSTDYLLGRVETPDSFVIKELAYDAGTLYVRFRDNDWYKYSDVPEEVYKSFVESPSKGKFFRQNIMTDYASARCTEPPAQ